MFSSTEQEEIKVTEEDVLALFDVDPIRVNIREMFPGVRCQGAHNGNVCVFDVVSEKKMYYISEDLVPCPGCKQKMEHLLSPRVVLRDNAKSVDDVNK